MHTLKQKQSRTGFFEELRVEKVMSCFEVREKLDELFDGNSMLEESTARFRRSLFAHLENCRGCCRAFDVRVGLRSAGRRSF